MNADRIRRQKGFVLIMTMLILLILTILVVNAVRSSTLEEQMAGSYMDRNRAMQAAERALQEGRIALNTLDAADNPICLDGCGVDAAGAVVQLTPGATCASLSPNCATAMPGAWADASGKEVVLTKASDGKEVTRASYRMILLDDPLREPDKAGLGCKAYSIMGRGQGFDSRTAVILQTVAYVCPLT